MRKKLLRSRSGFEKPESREEAIMQNILGASNVLEPAESNIEEILQAILYNTPYTKEAEFEIEKILLAIKNNGTYDGEGESRDMKILIAILNGLDYTEEAESRIEELFIEWLHQRSSIKVLEGVPPLTFTSLGLPLINYLIEGNTVQSGTPTPTTPIQPSECGERTGNLWSANSTISKERSPSYYAAYLETPLPTGTYTFSAKVSGEEGVTACRVSFRKSNMGQIVASNIEISSDRTSITVTLSEPCYAVYMYGSNDTTTLAVVTYQDIMLNTGSTPLPFEPYGIKIPISSANTTTPVYLGEVETTRKVRKWVLKGDEDGWFYSSGFVYNQNITPDYLRSTAQTVLCSHFKAIPNVTAGGNVGDGKCALYSISGVQRLFFRDSNYTTSAADFKSYLAAQYAAGTPVTVWYVLAEPTTGIVNEPLMKIGDYVDSISKAQAGVEIPTVNGSNTLDVDTTVKPSNIYIEYK